MCAAEPTAEGVWPAPTRCLLSGNRLLARLISYAGQQLIQMAATASNCETDLDVASWICRWQAEAAHPLRSVPGEAPNRIARQKLEQSYGRLKRPHRRCAR